MRLQNVQSIGKYQYRMVCDTDKASANYIERTTGVFYDQTEYEHRCLKCLEPSKWLDWPTNNRANYTCTCSQYHTLELFNFDKHADILVTPKHYSEYSD